MKSFIFIFYIVIFSFIASSSFANKIYNFDLKVISDDNLLKREIEDSFVKNLNQFQNLEIKDDQDFRDGVSTIVLYVYGKKHENSNVDKQIITFSIAHTSNTEFMNLMAEVFGNDKMSQSSNQMKAITSDLLINNKAILKYLNVASIDNLDQMDVVTKNILKSLSLRIENYYLE